MQKLYSIRMRASRGGPHESGGKHISGAETIVPEESVLTALGKLFIRAREHERGQPDFINIKIELLRDKDIPEVASLPVYTIRSRDFKDGRELARKVLQLAGIKPEVIKQGFSCLLRDSSGCGSGMRGAILMDVKTGRRVEPDPSRGVRASRMDYTPGAKKKLFDEIEKLGLHKSHLPEALCLATKVAGTPGIVAELCWSDDPGYTAGYVASSRLGYVRFNHLKEKGNCRGGRVFFFDSSIQTREEVIVKLEQEPCLITELGLIYGEMTYEEFCQQHKEYPANEIY
ncbi:MAG: 6-carboxyhexanoate--CoA ligase [Firmicutes bacterium]|nr:6-carboxyhexanoate--CoA ligase [Bacillota bacterium]